MSETLISVVIPVWNEEKRVARAIDSIRKQTHKNLEIIVVDDGSSDRTGEIVKKIAKEDSRVSLRTNPHVPPRTNWRGYDINAGWAARNYGFQLAQGEWITTQDADDASLLNRIEIQHRFAQKYNADLVTVQWMRLTEETLDKTFDIERLLREKGEKNLLLRPNAITEQAAAQRGILMREPWHQYIPFTIKWFPYTRLFFYRRQDPYPGADNCMFFHRRVRDSGYSLRARNERTWGVPSGRGSGRDFVYRIAYERKNSYSIYAPLYLWNVNMDNPEYPIDVYRSYLV